MKTMNILIIISLLITWTYSRANNEEHENLGVIQDIMKIKTELGEIQAVIKNSILLTEKECSFLGERWINHNDSSGRFLLGSSTDYQLGSTGGQANIRLSEREMPNHSHRQILGVKHQTTAADERNLVQGGSTGLLVGKAVHSTASKGRGEPHENMPPYKVVNLCVYQ